DAQQRGFAGAVEAQHADLCPGQEAEPDIVEDLAAAGIDLGQAFHDVDVLVGGHRRSAGLVLGPGLLPYGGAGANLRFRHFARRFASSASSSAANLGWTLLPVSTVAMRSPGMPPAAMAARPDAPDGSSSRPSAPAAACMAFRMAASSTRTKSSTSA